LRKFQLLLLLLVSILLLHHHHRRRHHRRRRRRRHRHRHRTTTTTTTTITTTTTTIIIKIADNITAIPLLEMCSTGFSEVTIKGLNYEWATYLLENLLLMDVTFIRVGNFYVLFPQNMTQ
jgi:hypothetical protein